MMDKLRDDPDVVEEVIKQLRKLPWQVGLRYVATWKFTRRFFFTKRPTLVVVVCRTK